MEQPKETTVTVREKPLMCRPEKIARMEELRKEALAKADAMVSGKGADYGHWSAYPEIVLASLNFVKAKRTLELAIQRASNPTHQAKNEPFEDSALDGINYLSFLHARSMSVKEGLL